MKREEKILQVTDSKAADVFANSDVERKYSAGNAVQCHKIRSHIVLHIKIKLITGLSFTTYIKKTLKMRLSKDEETIMQV